MLGSVNEKGRSGCLASALECLRSRYGDVAMDEACSVVPRFDGDAEIMRHIDIGDGQPPRLDAEPFDCSRVHAFKESDACRFSGPDVFVRFPDAIESPGRHDDSGLAERLVRAGSWIHLVLGDPDGESPKISSTDNKNLFALNKRKCIHMLHGKTGLKLKNVCLTDASSIERIACGCVRDMHRRCVFEHVGLG
jgi:hypothetical protein